MGKASRWGMWDQEFNFEHHKLEQSISHPKVILCEQLYIQTWILGACVARVTNFSNIYLCMLFRGAVDEIIYWVSVFTKKRKCVKCYRKVGCDENWNLTTGFGIMKFRSCCNRVIWMEVWSEWVKWKRKEQIWDSAIKWSIEMEQ